MAKISAKHFGLIYAPDDYLFADRRFAIGRLAAKHADPFRHVKYRLWFAVAWDWLPKIGWLPEECEPPGYPSSRWTGRHARMFNWSWLLRFDCGRERA